MMFYSHREAFLFKQFGCQDILLQKPSKIGPYEEILENDLFSKKYNQSGRRGRRRKKFML